MNNRLSSGNLSLPPMRTFAAIALLFSVFARSARAEEDDDPRARRLADSASPAAQSAAPPPPINGPAAVARIEIAPSALLAAGEDDPKLQREAGVRDRGPFDVERAHETPAVKLSYRHLDLPNLKGAGMSDTADLSFHVIELDMYPISQRYLRLALDAEFGYGIGVLDDKPNRAWSLVTGANLGFQYPWRVTPFLDGRFLAGLLGGDVTGQTAITWLYMLGFDSGIEVYLAGRFYLSAAIGYLHTSYSGVDLPYTKAHPTEEARRATLSGDTFTFKIGLGL